MQAKGAYEAGFLKALSEFNIQPDAIAGTSIGALNGSLYSANVHTKEVAVLVDKIWKDLAKTPALQADKKKVCKNIVEVIDGNSLFENCGLGLNKCNDKKPCPVHHKFKLVKEGVLEMLESTTVQYMALQMKKGKTFLKS